MFQSPETELISENDGLLVIKQLMTSTVLGLQWYKDFKVYHGIKIDVILPCASANLRIFILLY